MQKTGSLAHRFFHQAQLALTDGISPLRLRGVTRLGKRARVEGTPFIENLGSIVIGDDFRLSSSPVRSHIVTGHGGKIVIGQGVSIGAGAGIASDASITIGDRVQIGPMSMIMDTDFHDIVDMNAASETASVVIEEDARLDARVTVLKGARIGKGAWIAAGSVVSGVIPPGAFASGVPARVVRERKAGAGARVVKDAAEVLESVTRVVAETFAVTGPVDPSDGPGRIKGWDSLGTLRLLLGIEDEFQIVLPEDALQGVKRVSDLVDVVEARLEQGRE